MSPQNFQQVESSYSSAKAIMWGWMALVAAALCVFGLDRLMLSTGSGDDAMIVFVLPLVIGILIGIPIIFFISYSQMKKAKKAGADKTYKIARINVFVTGLILLGYFIAPMAWGVITGNY